MTSRVPAAILFLVGLLAVVSCAAAPRTLPGKTGVFGRVSGPSGEPVANAFVYAYLASRGGVRGAADFGIRTEPDGSYLLDLVPGNYRLVARRRGDGGGSGPPRAGDDWALFAGNPVAVDPGQMVRADFQLHAVTQPRLLRAGSLGSGDTGFRGRVLDRDGNPVAGAIVLAFPSPDYRKMPEFTSAPTDRQGGYLLFVPAEGTFCLAARTRSRGQPAPGELYGLLGQGTRGCLAVGEGEIRETAPIILRPFGAP